MAPRTSQPAPKKRSIFLTVLIALIGLGVLLAAGGFTFAASQETHDPFCASCHTQPETQFYERSTALQPVDLASYHTPQKTRCIDCHSGVGISGRMQAELMGARNAFKWYSGTAVQPALLTIPISDDNCLKCHQDVTQRGYQPKQTVQIPGARQREGEEEEGGANHWHELMTRWQAAASDAGACTSCHPAHSASGTLQTGFQDVQATRDQCDSCHRALRQEGRGD